MQNADPERELSTQVAQRARIYRPSDTVPLSGIYSVLHRESHRGPHEVVMIGRDRFPKCEICGREVHYRLMRSAPYVFEDHDFEAAPQ
jgi:trimethylamine:corrinoid methyltransferase-like protein